MSIHSLCIQYKQRPRVNKVRAIQWCLFYCRICCRWGDTITWRFDSGCGLPSYFTFIDIEPLLPLFTNWCLVCIHRIYRAVCSLLFHSNWLENRCATPCSSAHAYKQDICLCWSVFIDFYSLHCICLAHRHRVCISTSKQSVLLRNSDVWL